MTAGNQVLPTNIRDNVPLPDWKRPALVGYFLIILAFGVLSTWSAFAKLASAVAAPGVVSLKSGRKIIQHFERGIIAKILVHEGEHVQRGQVLFVLDDTIAQANATAVKNELYALLAKEARLVAERADAKIVTYPPELKDNPARIIKDTMTDENKQFAERHASLSGEMDILKSRIERLQTKIQGISDEKAAAETQLGLVNSELKDLRILLSQALVQKTRVLALEVEKARFEGIIGQAVADIAKTQSGIDEAHLQIDQLRKKFSQAVTVQLVNVREKIAELREKVTVAQDILNRTKIRAPRTGAIQNIRVATVGGVIRPGEPLAELIPDNENLVINADFSPTDADAIQAGMQAEVRFSAFHGYTLPLIMGRVDTVSRDRIVNEQSKRSYFLARVIVDKKDVPTIVKDHMRAGMAAEVLVETGERTVLSYLSRPLLNSASSAFREK